MIRTLCSNCILKPEKAKICAKSNGKTAKSARFRARDGAGEADGKALEAGTVRLLSLYHIRPGITRFNAPDPDCF
ncbi:MAG: hypothetical protein IJR83_06200 [Clostridia bacterium]|nr:hypothetical protein [Clostridia bacterium]